MASALASLRHLLLGPGLTRCMRAVFFRAGLCLPNSCTCEVKPPGFGAVRYRQLELRTRDAKVPLALLWLAGCKCPIGALRDGKGMEIDTSTKESWERNPLGESVRPGQLSRAEVSFCRTAHSQG